ncbi:unnamed protein product [Caenorhabditis bovis]|uniref:Uncharacterized protein n=1 Tax=Caenorhabditis bovis TaxID=2654633 RepID=A0A8S1FDN3_9PELO|nr:unnamed protein product [Caenorhabditis bovis]
MQFCPICRCFVADYHEHSDQSLIQWNQQADHVRIATHPIRQVVSAEGNAAGRVLPTNGRSTPRPSLENPGPVESYMDIGNAAGMALPTHRQNGHIPSIRGRNRFHFTPPPAYQFSERNLFASSSDLFGAASGNVQRPSVADLFNRTENMPPHENEEIERAEPDFREATARGIANADLTEAEMGVTSGDATSTNYQ